MGASLPHTQLCLFELFTLIPAPCVSCWCEWVMLGMNWQRRVQCGTGRRLDEIFNGKARCELTKS
jgi:hypothetical protein